MRDLEKSHEERTFTACYWADWAEPGSPRRKDGLGLEWNGHTGPEKQDLYQLDSYSTSDFATNFFCMAFLVAFLNHNWPFPYTYLCWTLGFELPEH